MLRFRGFKKVLIVCSICLLVLLLEYSIKSLVRIINQRKSVNKVRKLEIDATKKLNLVESNAKVCILFIKS